MAQPVAAGVGAASAAHSAAADSAATAPAPVQAAAPSHAAAPAAAQLPGHLMRATSVSVTGVDTATPAAPVVPVARHSVALDSLGHSAPPVTAIPSRTLEVNAAMRDACARLLEFVEVRCATCAGRCCCAQADELAAAVQRSTGEVILTMTAEFVLPEEGEPVFTHAAEVRRARACAAAVRADEALPCSW